MSKSKLFVRSTAELDEIELILLKHGTELLSFLRVETLVLKFDGIKLDTDNKLRSASRPNRLGNLKNQTSPVLKRSTVIVRPLVRCGRKELRKKISVSAVELL